MLSFYYSLCLDLSETKVQEPKKFSFDNYKLMPIKTPNLVPNKTIILRPNDINFLELDSLSYGKALEYYKLIDNADLLIKYY